MIIKNALFTLILCFSFLYAQSQKTDSDTKSIANNLEALTEQLQEEMFSQEVYLETVVQYDSLQQLCKTDPENSLHKLNLGTVCKDLYLFHNEVLDYEKASSYAKEAYDIYQRLLQKEPDNQNYKAESCTALYHLSQIAELLENHEEFVFYSNTSINLSKELHESNPRDSIHAWNYFAYLSDLVRYYSIRFEHEKSLPLSEKGMAFYEEVLSTLLPETEVNTIHISLLNNVGNTHTRAGNIDKAIDALLESLEKSKSLISNNPSNIELEEKSLRTYMLLGDAYMEVGDAEKAILFLKKGVILKERIESKILKRETSLLDEFNRSFVEYQMSPYLYLDLGNAYLAVNNLDKAGFFFQKFYDECDISYAIKYADNIMRFSEAELYLGKVTALKGNTDIALQFYESAKAKMEMVLEADPNMDSKNLAECYSLLGEHYFAQKNFNQAFIFYHSSYKLWDSLYQKYPKNSEIKRIYAVSYRQQGEVRSALGDDDKVIGLLEKNLRLTQELCEAYPQQIKFKQELASVRHVMGTFYKEKEKNTPEARQHFNQSFEIRKKLAATYPDNPKLQEEADVAKKALESTYR